MDRHLLACLEATEVFAVVEAMGRCLVPDAADIGLVESRGAAGSHAHPFPAGMAVTEARAETERAGTVVRPLVARGRDLGVLRVARRGGRDLDDGAVARVETVAKLGALALEGLRVAEERDRALRSLEDQAATLAAFAEAKRMLEVSNRELDQFAYVASHDLKAPLRGIANLSQWLEMDLGSAASPDVTAKLGLLRGRVDRMECLINGLLQYARAGREPAHREQVVVSDLLTEIVDIISPPPGIRITLGVPLPTLLTSRVALQQVFLNLLGNAVKHLGRPSGRVHIDGRPTERGTTEFSVTDDGPGIEGRYHDRIFQMFHTLLPRDRLEGAGIGLALVKKIVESRGGAVWVESSPGQGATFRFTWPA